LTDGLLYNPAFWSYGLAAILFVGFGVRLAIAWRGGLRASILLGAIVASALWTCAVVVALAFPGASGWWVAARVLDVGRIGAWLAFLALLLDGWQPGRAARPWATTARWLIGVAAVLLALGLLAPDVAPRPEPGAASGPTHAFTALLGLAILGLVLVEQLWRRTPEHGRWGVKPLVVGLAGVFAFDLFLYSDATLFRHLDPEIWAARGIVHALVIPFVALATARNTAWTVDLHLSRGAAFSSTALLISGVYLLVVAGAGYWVRLFGGSWGKTLQVAFVFAALLFLAALAFSGTLRSRLKVFVSKHFFSYRYDYRQEWLRFTRVLATPEAGRRFDDQLVHALADLVESRGGALWLERDGKFWQTARDGLAAVAAPEPASGPLAAFLARTGWVVRLEEYAQSPGSYPGLELPAWLAGLADAWLVVPLASGAELIGFVVLVRPRAPVDVNWEVLDLLKTASSQAASYLAQRRAADALLEAQKFDAFNRMSAFVVHDLKNLVAQLTLLLRNAERYRHNPEFQRDALETIDHVTQRMNALMLQLRTGTTPVERPKPVDLAELVRKQHASKSAGRASVALDIAASAQVLGHEDRLERVIGHLIQNALEATAERGSVTVRVFGDGPNAVVEVADNGIGMAPEFIRDKLFKPFQTTKPHGMGIGVYESFQYVTGLGGRMLVDSTPNVGTRVRVLLPRLEVGGGGEVALKEVA
jgi:putative PEP-CTERM system histidine kinase